MNEGLEGKTAHQLIESNEADTVAFGKLFISNPDLVYRLKEHKALSDWDATKFF